MRNWIVGCLVSTVWLAGCGGDPRAVDFGAPEDPGPFDVGRTTLMIDDGEGTGRTLPVDVWYPARPGEDAAPTTYTVEALGLEAATAPSPMDAVRDAPPDAQLAPYPVVVFSHGNGGIRFQSIYLTEHLASHGYVVAAPDHVGNTITSQFTGSGVPRVESARLRPIDVSRTLDVLLSRTDDEESVLYGMVDRMKAGVAGHSFGGYTALRIAGATIDVDALRQQCMSGSDGGLLCDDAPMDFDMPDSQRDDRFDVALPQAPGGAAAFETGNGFADVAVPTMIQGGTADMTTPPDTEQRPPFQDIPSPGWLMLLEDAGHFTYSDMCLLLDMANPVVSEIPEFQDLESYAESDGCGPDNLPPEEAHALINRFSTAFLHTHLADRPGYADDLDPASPKPDAVATFERK